MKPGALSLRTPLMRARRNLLRTTRAFPHERSHLLLGAYCGSSPARIQSPAVRCGFFTSSANTVHIEGVALAHQYRQLHGQAWNRPLLLAASPEQQRIVTKLDNLLKRSKCAREELARIPRLIERYKQAIFGAAFRGLLTAEWRLNTLGKSRHRPSRLSKTPSHGCQKKWASSRGSRGNTKTIHP